MGKKIIRLTESDLIKIVKRVLSEDDFGGNTDPNQASAGMEQPHYYFNCEDKTKKKEKYDALNLYTKKVRQFLITRPNYQNDDKPYQDKQGAGYTYVENYHFNNEDFDYDDTWKKIPPPFDINIKYVAKDDCNTCRLEMTGEIYDKSKTIRTDGLLDLIGVKNMNEVVTWINNTSNRVLDSRITGSGSIAGS